MKRCNRILACFLTVLLALFLCVGTGNVARAANPVNDAKEGVARVVYIYSDEAGNIYSQSGTCFFLGKPGEPVEYLVTNAHVITVTDNEGNVLLAATEAYVVFEDIDADSTMKAKVIKNFFGAPDLAMLRLSAPTTLRKPLAILSSESLETVDPVYALGYPGVADDTTGMAKSTVDDVTVTTGSVTKKLFLVDEDRYVQTDAAVHHGNSGGPLVNADGVVVGINTLMFDANFYCALYTDYVIEYFDTMGYPYQLGSAASASPSGDEGAAATTEDGGSAVPADADAAAEDEESSWLKKNWYVIVLAAAVLALAAVLIVMRVKKRKPAAPVSGSVERRTAPVQPAGRQIVSIGNSNVLGGKAYSVRGGVTVGRDSTRCQIVFPAQTPGISAAHCSVRDTADGVIVMDLGSSYGTLFANGTKMDANKPYSLRVGDTFYLASKDNGFRVK